MKQKLFLFFMLMLLPLMASAFSRYYTEIDGIYYHLVIENQTDYVATVTCEAMLENKYVDTYTYTPVSANYSGSVVIPPEVTYNGSTYRVRAIAGSAFASCSGLTSISIPNSVTSISSNAFEGCSGLTSISIPNSVTSISSNAFEGCSGLVSISIPEGLTSIGGAFDGTAWYNNQSNGLVYINNLVYKYKGTMPENTSITLPDETLAIADNAFFGCSGLASITIPDGVK